MANNITSNIKNGKLSSYNLNPVVTNSPDSIVPRYSKYTDESSAYYDRYAKYADNVFDAEMQGLDYTDFYKWTKVRIRSSNVINPSTGENLSTSWQSILILDRKLDFIPIGAYIRYAGSTWIVYNPDNIASTTANAIVIRCNTTYNTLDYYGNIVKTPMFFAKGTVLASSPYYMEYSATLDGYQHVIMQLNDVTENITNNTRIILGKSAFGMYGVSDFPEEFTGDPNSCHILRADLRLQETIEADDLVNHIADKKYFSFILNLGANEQMYVGEKQLITVHARREGKLVESTDENPITFLWSSSDENVATVDEYGYVTVVSAGSCTITCTLAQNENVTATIDIIANERISQSYVDFVTPIPNKLKALETIEIEASYYENGNSTEDRVEYSLEGADENSYSYDISGNVLSIHTWIASSEPLIIRASCNGYEVSAEIQIVGY